jgi:hypothetical protein
MNRPVCARRDLNPQPSAYETAAPTDCATGADWSFHHSHIVLDVVFHRSRNLSGEIKEDAPVWSVLEDSTSTRPEQPLEVVVGIRQIVNLIGEPAYDVREEPLQGRVLEDVLAILSLAH